MNIDELIKRLNELDFVRNPKNKAAATVVEEAIATLKEYKNNHIPDPDDSKLATIVLKLLATLGKEHPEIMPEIKNNRAFTLFCDSIKKPADSFEFPHPPAAPAKRK